MTHDEIIKLIAYGKFQPEVAAWFIAYGMGAAAEREECAKVCDAEANNWNEPFGYALADAIRARGQA